MMFRLFKSALSIALLTQGALVKAVPPVAPAATPAVATPTPVEKKPKEGYVRFWNMLPRTGPKLQLIQDSAAKEAEAILTATPRNYHAGYLPLPQGRYALKVVSILEPSVSLKTFDVVLRPNVFVTILATEKDGSPNIELVDNTYNPETEPAGKLVIRNVFKDSKVIITSSATQPRTVAYGDAETVENIPLQLIFFRLQAVGPNGKTEGWSTEVDFRISRHASLLLLEDPYGRFTAGTSIDGQVEK